METPKPELRFENCGQVIRKFRQDAGVTLRSLADSIGCGPGQLSKIETNALSVSQTMIERIAKQLEVPTSAIVLKCLEERFPRLHDTPAGQIVAQFLSQSG